MDTLCGRPHTPVRLSYAKRAHGLIMSRADGAVSERVRVRNTNSTARVD